ncbi:peptidoglycan-associated lipoprotein Pal [Rickettsiales bacterium]|nr:peptidoglycan-associated lipoprotein Pal [Rickettsiales bacterium]MDB2550307.1 peptidoglycan-associated lipoprotein Pal [Rickettsiales bacterium]
MFKKISSLILVLFLASCFSSKKSVDLAETTDQEMGQYEVINNEEEAAKLNEEVSTEIAEEVEVEDRIFFALNSSTLNDEAKAVLDGQSEWLKSEANINIIIEGHCDERGTREYNIALGEKRANASRDYLVSKGVDSSRIKTVSYGKERPALIGNGESIWSKNRRAVTVPVE